MIPKFRAFDIETKTIRDVLTINFETSNVVVDMGYADIYETTRWNALLKKGDYILMQSTGMRDVNGMEIYEGDIVEYYHLGKIIAVVKMVDGCWVLDKQGLNTEFEHLFPESEIGKIIGNIYENEDLIVSEEE